MKPSEARIVLTGANGGIGRETAAAFIGAGASVLLVGRSAAQLSALSRSIQTTAREHAGRIAWQVADLGKAAQVGELGGIATEWRCNVLVHAAGVPCFGALEHMDHAEEAHRIAPGDRVVGIGDHHFSRMARSAVSHGVGIPAARPDVGEDPLVVADLFFDVLLDGLVRPFGPAAESGAAGAHERDGVAHVVVGLPQEGQVARQRDLAAQASLNDGRAEEPEPLVGGLTLQPLMES